MVSPAGLFWGLRLGSVEKLVVPGHLDGFELAFGGALGIVFELGQCGYIAMQIGETDRQRLELGMLL